MDFDLPADIENDAGRARFFAGQRRDRPIPPAFDIEGWRAAAAFGAFSPALPPAWGGTGRGALAAFAVFEALGSGGMDRSLLFAMGAHLFGCAVPVAAYAAAGQSAAWGKKLASGEAIGALAVTEPTGGSTLALPGTQAAQAPGGYRVNGEKTLICNAPQASLFLVLARHPGTKGPLGLSALLVPAETEGVRVTAIAPTVGLRGAPMGAVHFSDCFVPADMVLGTPGAGLKIFSTAMQWERTCLLAGFLGAAGRDLAMTVDALRGRRDAEGALWRHQAIAHPCARMKLRLDAARLIAYRAALAIDGARGGHREAAMAKLALSEAAAEAAQLCLRLMAGAAWKKEPAGFGDALADTLGGLFASGTTEVLLDILARDLQTEPGPK